MGGRKKKKKRRNVPRVNNRQSEPKIKKDGPPGKDPSGTGQKKKEILKCLVQMRGKKGM